jgi:hypothetical protein
MSIYQLSAFVAFASLIFSIVIFALRWQAMTKLPFLKNDRSAPKDSALKGIVYAFTLGMAPWAKESTRIHRLAYMRGIAFHVGIFAGLAALIASPWFDAIPFVIRALFAAITGAGALMGAAGGVMRIAEENLRGISTRDDHAAVWLVSFWLAVTAIALIYNALAPVMFIVSAVMLVYAPVSKIRHCIYFYYARLFYGLHIGRRGVVSGLVEHSIPFHATENRRPIIASGKPAHPV